MSAPGAAATLPRSRPLERQRLLTLAAWGVHLYTALGAVLGLLSIYFAADYEFRAAFIAMALATAIDSSDGPLARLLNVRQRIPNFDGALLDNVVDYLTYVAAPGFLMLRAGLLPAGWLGLALASVVMLAGAYGFCQTGAKTEDHYFLGFPSYWNLIAFYLFCFGWPLFINGIIVGAFAALTFIPIKYIYPNRTVILRPLTISLGIIWALVTIAMLPMLPDANPVLLWISFSYIAYYLSTSFALNARARFARLTASDAG